MVINSVMMASMTDRAARQMEKASTYGRSSSCEYFILGSSYVSRLVEDLYHDKVPWEHPFLDQIFVGGVPGAGTEDLDQPPFKTWLGEGVHLQKLHLHIGGNSLRPHIAASASAEKLEEAVLRLKDMSGIPRIHVGAMIPRKKPWHFDSAADYLAQCIEVNDHLREVLSQTPGVRLHFYRGLSNHYDLSSNMWSDDTHLNADFTQRFYKSIFLSLVKEWQR